MDILAVLSGFGAGAIVGMTGVGGGLLTLVAVVGHATLGHVDRALLAALLVGSLPGLWIGSQLTRLMPERLVRVRVSPVTAGLKVIH